MSEPATSPPAGRHRLLAGIALALATLAGLAQLYSAFCQYSWVRMSLNDYGIYTNFIWNSGHGAPFRYLLDKSYLTTHLSFTLLLLGPLFRLWDDPFLLTLVHWLCGMTAVGLVWRIAARHGLPPHLRAAVACCLAGYPYMQSVLLCEFHGVCAYFVLLPWLYYCLAFRPGATALPLLLILGLREEAGLLAIPLLLYFAVTRRWRAGYLYAGLALLYTIVAVKFMFPHLAGVALEERRGREISLAGFLDSLTDDAGTRLRAILFLLLPALPLLRRGWRPVLVFPLVALVILQASPVAYHHGLQRHYPAAVFTLLMLAVVHVLRADPAAPPRPRTGFAAYLVLLTVALHFVAGELPGGGNSRDFYSTPNPLGAQTRRAAAAIPKQGVLLTNNKLTGFTANRADLLTDQTARGREDLADSVFLPVTFLFDDKGEPWRQRLREGRLGVTYFDHYYAVLQKGAATTGNAEVLQMAKHVHRTINLHTTGFDAGRNRVRGPFGLCRYWEGDGSRAWASVAYGRYTLLPPGRYEARFRLAATTPARNVRGSWGRLQLFISQTAHLLAEQEIDKTPSPPGVYRWQSATFDLPERARVEPRILGADAPLYLDRVIFVPLDEPAARPPSLRSEDQIRP